MDVRERTRLANVYRREATTRGIVSPFRQDEYIKARLKGKSPEQAETVAKKGPRR